MEITQENFFIKTRAFFKGCKKPQRKPDFVSKSNYDYSVSSMYWYGEDKKGKFVVRFSNHWSDYKDFKNNRRLGCERIRSCKWFLRTTKIEDKWLSGKAYFDKFQSM